MSINTCLWLERKHSKYLQLYRCRERSLHCTLPAEHRLSNAGAIASAGSEGPITCLEGALVKLLFLAAARAGGCTAEGCANDSRCLAEHFSF